MSKGPGVIESGIAELFAAAPDRPLSVAEIADHAFSLEGRPATRAQRLSATRAAHRFLRRTREAFETAKELFAEAAGDEQSEPYKRAKKLWDFAAPFSKTYFVQASRRGTYLAVDEFWRATAGDGGALYFHAPDVPVKLWAVSIQPAGVIWADAEIVGITERFVSARYAGDTARLNRGSLWRGWAVWRGVKFVSSRDGRAARLLDDLWQDRYGRASGGVPPVMQMALAEAMALLGVPSNFTAAAVLSAFRREAKKAHPDLGGTAEKFTRLVEARDRLLASLGTSAPAPKPPQYAPKGMTVVYRRVRDSGALRLGSTRQIR